jgi:predicted nucleic-acid-binding protein
MLNRKKAAFLVCDRVLIETVWLLRSHYDWTVEELAGAFATFSKDIVKRHMPFAGTPR